MIKNQVQNLTCFGKRTDLMVNVRTYQTPGLETFELEGIVLLKFTYSYVLRKF